MTTVANEHRQL